MSSSVPNGIEIVVRTLEHGTHEVVIPSEAPLIVLKNALEQITGEPVDRQRVLHRGRELSDNRATIQALNLRDGVVLHMVGRPPTDAPVVGPTAAAAAAAAGGGGRATGGGDGGFASTPGFVPGLPPGINIDDFSSMLPPGLREMFQASSAGGGGGGGGNPTIVPMSLNFNTGLGEGGPGIIQAAHVQQALTQALGAAFGQGTFTGAGGNGGGGGGVAGLAGGGPNGQSYSAPPPALDPEGNLIGPMALEALDRMLLRLEETNMEQDSGLNMPITTSADLRNPALRANWAQAVNGFLRAARPILAGAGLNRETMAAVNRVFVAADMQPISLGVQSFPVDATESDGDEDAQGRGGARGGNASRQTAPPASAPASAAASAAAAGTRAATRQQQQQPPASRAPMLPPRPAPRAAPAAAAASAPRPLVAAGAPARASAPAPPIRREFYAESLPSLCSDSVLATDSEKDSDSDSLPALIDDSQSEEDNDSIPPLVDSDGDSGNDSLPPLMEDTGESAGGESDNDGSLPPLMDADGWTETEEKDKQKDKQKAKIRNKEEEDKKKVQELEGGSGSDNMPSLFEDGESNDEEDEEETVRRRTTASETAATAAAGPSQARAAHKESKKTKKEALVSDSESEDEGSMPSLLPTDNDGTSDGDEESEDDLPSLYSVYDENEEEESEGEFDEEYYDSEEAEEMYTEEEEDSEEESEEDEARRWFVEVPDEDFILVAAVTLGELTRRFMSVTELGSAPRGVNALVMRTAERLRSLSSLSTGRAEIARQVRLVAGHLTRLAASAAELGRNLIYLCSALEDQNMYFLQNAAGHIAIRDGRVVPNLGVFRPRGAVVISTPGGTSQTIQVPGVPGVQAVGITVTAVPNQPGGGIAPPPAQQTRAPPAQQQPNQPPAFLRAAAAAAATDAPTTATAPAPAQQQQQPSAPQNSSQGAGPAAARRSLGSMVRLFLERMGPEGLQGMFESMGVEFPEEANALMTEAAGAFVALGQGTETSLDIPAIVNEVTSSLEESIRSEIAVAFQNIRPRPSPNEQGENAPFSPMALPGIDEHMLAQLQGIRNIGAVVAHHAGPRIVDRVNTVLERHLRRVGESDEMRGISTDLQSLLGVDLARILRERGGGSGGGGSGVQGPRQPVAAPRAAAPAAPVEAVSPAELSRPTAEILAAAAESRAAATAAAATADTRAPPRGLGLGGTGLQPRPAARTRPPATAPSTATPAEPSSQPAPAATGAPALPARPSRPTTTAAPTAPYAGGGGGGLASMMQSLMQNPSVMGMANSGSLQQAAGQLLGDTGSTAGGGGGGVGGGGGLNIGSLINAMGPMMGQLLGGGAGGAGTGGNTPAAPAPHPLDVDATLTMELSEEDAERWKAVLEGDRAAMENNKSGGQREGFSDAYLCAMPPRSTGGLLQSLGGDE